MKLFLFLVSSASIFCGVISAESYRSITMPCCIDSIGNATCGEIRRRRPEAFQRKCAVDVEFGMIQCCVTCGNDVAKMGAAAFAAGSRSRQCFDRHDRDFCLRFLYRLEPWTNDENNQGCSGSSAPLAFRICRKTCGFCNKRLYLQRREPRFCPQPKALVEEPDLAYLH